MFNKNLFTIFELSQHTDIETLKEKLHQSAKLEFTNDVEHADFVVAYGGDGTLLDAFQKFPNKIIIPIRDYDVCDFHKDFKKYFANNLIEIRDVISCCIDSTEYFAISEVVLRNANITQAVRFDLYLNDKPYALNCIGDGLIISTALGSTGYFKNITNMIFSEGIGIGFLNSTQRMTNFIIDKNVKIKIIITRGICNVGIDHTKLMLKEQQSIELAISQNQKLSLLNYKNAFMCNDCRNNRHSGLVNSIYSVL